VYNNSNNNTIIKILKVGRQIGRYIS